MSSSSIDGRRGLALAERVYGFLGLAVSVAAYPFFLGHPRGRTRLAERYGAWPVSADGAIWFHGASAGEMKGLLPIIRVIKRELPESRFMATCTSPSGLAVAEAEAGTALLAPFDSLPWIRRALGDARPRMFVFGETELWPALIGFLADRRVPIAMVNARISDFTLGRYKLLKPFLERTLSKVDLIFASSELARERLVELGAPEDRCFVAGNAKYEIEPSVKTEEERSLLRRQFFATDLPVLTLGSLWPGEDDVWIPAIERFVKESPRLNVVIAPRHQERFSYFASRLSESGIPFRRWSEGRMPTEPVVLLDTFGMLEKVYSFSDAAFIGATLVSVGGHNPLEPAAYGACVAMGPHVQNIREVRADLAAADACVEIGDVDDAGLFLGQLASRDSRVRERGDRARSVWQSYSGAAERVGESLLELLSGARPG